MEKYVIIVAGGKGLRMGNALPKQFIPIGGKPLLMHTIDVFYQYDKNIHIILVLPIGQQAYWKELCKEYAFQRPYLLANGGDTRFHSVQNGLSLIDGQENGIVGVHDGVRPFVSIETIKQCYDTAERLDAVVPVTDINETIRYVSSTSQSHTVNRDEYKLVQTPQVFNLQLLKQAYQQEYIETFTDDASVVEAMGKTIHLVTGNRENIKITTPFDLTIAETLLKQDV
ncbi:MAG: 2-C-methyl-D-erythritol 4-phosphate cytidylyltransferase [Bacteroidaceae bacterium]|nr:2-C-methyl-D-erythritol 4-phosphate cytidylyltransferase [Bacteroidaceae bacterium]